MFRLLPILFLLVFPFNPSNAIYHILELDRGITQGVSLEGKTAKELQTGRYNCEVSGRVINYSRWPLTVLSNECAEGRGHFLTFFVLETVC